MKAAVLKRLGGTPVYGDFEDPTPATDDDLLINVKAASIKNIDKLMAGGKSYVSYKKVPVVVGIDGVGVTESGTKVYAQGRTGMLAEKAVISRDKYIELPDNIDMPSASAIPNAAMGSYLPLKVRAKIKKGDVVLINGGTGVTGKMAIQLAKFYGASRVIVAGRVKDREEELKSLGADQFISTEQEDEAFIKQLKQMNEGIPLDIVIDYLWGRSAELIINHLAGEGVNNFAEQPAKFITVGEMAGKNITLRSDVLRSSMTEILGSGFGSFREEEFQTFKQKILPEIFQMAADGKLRIDVQEEKLENIEEAWNKDAGGKRIVVTI